MKKKLLYLLPIFMILVGAILIYTNGVNPRSLTADSGFDSSWSSGSSSSSSHSSSSSSSSIHSSSHNSGSGSGCDSTICYVASCIPLFVCMFFVISFIVYKIKQDIKHKRYLERLTNKLACDKIYSVVGNDFNIDEYNEFVFKAYYDIQIAWMNDTIKDVEYLLSDEMYNMYKTQLLTLSERNSQNVMSNIKKIDSYIHTIKKQDNTLIITSILKVTCRDYLIDKTSKKVLRGSRFKKNKYTYSVTFKQDLNVDKIDKCPTCGAEVKGSERVRCSYCKNLYIVKSNNFILTNKKMLIQK